MSRKKVAFQSSTILVNPARYPGMARKMKKLIRRISDPVIIETRDRDHFIEEVFRFYESENKYLFVWGGDGTAHEALNALMNAGLEYGVKKKAVGFFRGGSGNGIQDSYEVPFPLKRQIHTYAVSTKNNYTQVVDLLKVQSGTSVRYGQLVGNGFDAQVLAEREKVKHRTDKGLTVIKPGFFNYIAAGLKSYFKSMDDISFNGKLNMKSGKFSYKGPRINAEYPFTSFDKDVSALMLEIGTRPYYGKLFKVCPDVVCNDGFMDVYVFNFKNKLSVFMHFIELYNGWHSKINKSLARKRQPLIERYEVKKTTLTSQVPFHYHIDGELLQASRDKNGNWSIEISILPSALSFIVPERFYHKFHPFGL